MTDPPRLVLASASPRRRQLLAAAGYTFAVDPADADESTYDRGLEPGEVAALLAGRKADVVAARHPDAVVLASDTVVAVGGETVGKPADAADARRILGRLAGTRHEVVTAVRVVRRAAGFAVAEVVRSAVYMRPLSPAELDAYVASGLWEGKAGAYGIQDDDPFVIRTEGSLTNIVGLPMEVTADLLARAGIHPAR
jgi:septum formation protein